jgi:hypothetical protein
MTLNRKALLLHEELMLIVLRDREGTIAAADRYQYAIGGAVLAELMLHERIDVETVKKKQYARILNNRPLNDPLLDICLIRMGEAKRRAQLTTWVGRFAGTGNLKQLVAGQLVERDILRVSQDRILGIFKRTIYPELDPRPERRLTERIKRAVFGDSVEVDTRTAILISLAGSADLLKLIIDNKELKRRKRRIAQISNGELAGKATRAAIEAMQTAVMVACIMPAIMVSATAGH